MARRDAGICTRRRWPLVLVDVGVLIILVDVVGPQQQVFAVRGAEVVRTVGALVLPHGRPEATVAHTALLAVAQPVPHLC